MFWVGLFFFPPLLVQVQPLFRALGFPPTTSSKLWPQPSFLPLLPPTYNFFPHCPFPLKPGEPLFQTRLIKQSIWRASGGFPLYDDHHYSQQIMENKHRDRCLSQVQICTGRNTGQTESPPSGNDYLCPVGWIDSVCEMQRLSLHVCNPATQMTVLHLHQKPNQNPRHAGFTGGETIQSPSQIRKQRQRKGSDQSNCHGKRRYFLFPDQSGAPKINWTHCKSNIFQLILWVKCVLRTIRQKQWNIQLNLPSKTLPPNWYFQYPYWEMRREKRGGSWMRPRTSASEGSKTWRASCPQRLAALKRDLLFSQVTKEKWLQYLPSFIYYSYLPYSKKDMQQLKATLGF